MLAKGEVEEIIVRPDIEIVTIVLYDGAVIKGKRVRTCMYIRSNIIDTSNNKHKLKNTF